MVKCHRAILVAAGSTLLLAGTNAQETSAGSESLEEIVVYGTARNRFESITQKRESDRIVDALGTDELGQLPDKNLGESLNRIAGVSMLVEKGEGRYVQLRGIRPELNNVTLNGVAIGSPEAEGGGRVTPFDVLSGSMLSAVQVVKTPTADMDAQGIGGTVNIETRMPFDRSDSYYGYATARLGYEEVRPENDAFAGRDPYGVDALMSGKNDAATVGWLLGGSFSSREYVAQGIFQDDWREVDGTNLPEEVKNNYYIIGRERVNVSGAIELRPNDEVRYFVRGFYAAWDEFQHRNRFQQGLGSGVSAISAISGTADGNRISSNIRLEEVEKTLLSLTAGGENRFGETVTADYSFQLNKNEIAEPYSYWEFRSGSDFGPDAWDIGSNGVISITPDAAGLDRQDPDNIDFRRARFQDRDLSEDALIAAGNLEWTLDNGYVKAGLKFTTTDRENDFTRNRFDGGILDLNLGTESSFTNGAFTNDVRAGDVPNIWMDVGAMDRFFADPANADYFEKNDGDSFASNFSGDYDITESIYAAYVMGSHSIADWEIIGGIRFEQTDVDSTGFLLIDGEAQRASADGDYTSVLPSVIVNWRATDDIVLRGAVTRALGRPDYDVIAPRSRYNEELGEGSLSIGNSALEARHSWNYDLSAEWYPSDLTAISVALFYKDIDNEFVGRSERLVGQPAIDDAVASLGLTGAIDTSILDELTVATTENGESSQLFGVELAAQAQFTFLPSPFDGLGGAVSAAFVDAEVDILRDGLLETLPLPGQAETSYNVSLFFQNESLDAAVSFALNDSFLTEINGSRAEDLDQGQFGRWDARLAYTVRENFKLFFEGVNLNDEPTSEFQGGIKRQNTEFEYVGRTYYFGVSLGF